MKFLVKLLWHFGKFHTRPSAQTAGFRGEDGCDKLRWSSTNEFQRLRSTTQRHTRTVRGACEMASSHRCISTSLLSLFLRSRENKYQFSRARNNNNIYSLTFGRYVSSIFVVFLHILLCASLVFSFFSSSDSSLSNFSTTKLTRSFEIGNVSMEPAVSRLSMLCIVFATCSRCHMWICVVRLRRRTAHTHIQPDNDDTFSQWCSPLLTYDKCIAQNEIETQSRAGTE